MRPRNRLRQSHRHSNRNKPNEAGQRQRHACYGHCAYRRARQFGRPAWPKRHPADTRIDRSNGAKSDSDATDKPAAAKPRAGRTLARCRRSRTQQRRSAPYGDSGQTSHRAGPAAERIEGAVARLCAKRDADSSGTLSNTSAGDDVTPQLDLTPGTRIEAKLETQISSAVLTPVVAVVEYTYAIGDSIVIPAGARVYGSAPSRPIAAGWSA